MGTIKIYCLVNNVEVGIDNYAMLADFIKLKQNKPNQYMFFCYLGNKKLFLDLNPPFEGYF